MDGAMSLIEAHRVSDEVEAALEAAYPGAEIIIHQDPAGVPEKRSVLA
jgi:ferrous-iron efflux pump FieF